MINEHDVVALCSDGPEEGLMRGDTGAVTALYKGGEGYEVELMTVGGRTLAVLTMPDAQARPVSPDEMQQVRPLAVA